MRILQFKNVNDVARAVEEEMRFLVAKHNPLRVFLPTGKTPLPLYARLRDQAGFWHNKLDVIQIDDFIQADQPFFKVLENELVKPIGVKFSPWVSSWSGPQAKTHVDEVLRSPIHLAILGLGPNGHVGFHEPGYPSSFLGGQVQVSEETRARVSGAQTCEVFTFGVGAFLKAEEIFLIVTGKEKEKIFTEFEKSKPTESIPGTLLKGHPNLKVFTDIV